MFSRLKQLFLGRAPQQPQPLRIEGIPEAPFTPEPDDAELAAQALLELMANQSNRKTRSNQNTQSNQSNQTPAYYRALADRIREAHAKAAQQATRFIYNCEQMLQNKHLPLYGRGSVQLLETELYKRLDVVDREGGELKRRWQHCLAEVTVRLMKLAKEDSEEEEIKEQSV